MAFREFMRQLYGVQENPSTTFVAWPLFRNNALPITLLAMDNKTVTSTFTRTAAPSWERVASLYTDESDLVYRVCTRAGKPAQSLAHTAIRAGLYKQDGRLLDALLSVHATKRGHSIALVAQTDSTIPARFMGVAVVADGFCQVYVRPKWRRQGLGTNLVALLRQRGALIDGAGLGEKQSKAFWSAVQVPLRE